MKDSLLSAKKIAAIPPVVYLLIFSVALFSFTAKNFFTVGNLLNILRQASPLLVLATGETLAILIGKIDLSIGYLMSFSGLIAAYLIQAGFPLVLVIALPVLSVGLFGTVSGILIAKYKLPAFITTFGVGNIVFGVGLLISGGVSIPALDRSFRYLADGQILGFPVITLISLGIFGVMKYFTVFTAFGRNVYSLGGNREALFLSGVDVDIAEIKVYTVSAILAGCAGILFAARAASGYIGAGIGWEFDAIAAAIIGGNSFSEARGNINKTILGVLFIFILRNGLNMAGVNPHIQPFLVGVVVVFAISIDVFAKRKK
jgi:ribose/xylose/arabinose/galactoside ABC-type transport system permease subunit